MAPNERPVDTLRAAMVAYLRVTGWEETGDSEKPWRKPTDKYPVRRTLNDAVHIQMIYDDVDAEMASEASA